VTLNPEPQDLANTVTIDLTHTEAAALLRQLLHERCQSEATPYTLRPKP